MQVELKNDVYHLSGRIDEFAEFGPLKGAPAPLKLHLGRVTSINSIGVRKFLAFVLAWAPKRFEFFECTPEFITNVNVIPQMLGNPSDAKQVKSFFVPFACEPCKRVENVLYVTANLKRDADGEVVLDQRKCPKCGNAMVLDVEPTEYFMFLGTP